MAWDEMDAGCSQAGTSGGSDRVTSWGTLGHEASWLSAEYYAESFVDTSVQLIL
jgi:hypothetical protein